MSRKLSGGALVTICQGGHLEGPLLQVLSHKRIAGSSSDRYRLLVSDGQYSNSFAMLATQMNSKVSDGLLDNYTIIRVNKFICNNMQGKKVIIILDLDVVTPGSEVGDKIGSPQPLNPDGTVSDKSAGEKQKRSNDEYSGAQEPPNKKPLNVQNGQQPRSSILDPRPSVGQSPSLSACVQAISTLTPYQNKWTICARVTQKSDIRKWSNSRGEGCLFSMEFLDKSGEIKATAFKESCDKFYDLIQIGKVYYLSNATLKPANKQYNNTNNDYEITFKENTEIQLCQDSVIDEVPSMLFDFVKIGDLNDATRGAVVDVIGIVKQTGDSSKLVSSKTQKELTKREITLVDQSLSDVNMTLWGSLAETFDGSNNPVVAVKSAKVSDFMGISLSVEYSSTIMINPDIPQAHSLKGWFESEGNSAKTESLTSLTRTAGGGDSGYGANFKSLGEVKQENIGYSSDKPEYYSARATIHMFQKEKALYMACTRTKDGRQCNKKVIDNNGSYRCERCNEDNDDFNWRLILSMNIVDATDSLWINCFQETAETILGMSAQELGTYFQNDQDRYNQIFKNAIFKAYDFRFRAKGEHYNGETKVRHTIVSLSAVNWEAQNKKIIKELEEAGIEIPEEYARKNKGY